MKRARDDTTVRIGKKSKKEPIAPSRCLYPDVVILVLKQLPVGDIRSAMAWACSQKDLLEIMTRFYEDRTKRFLLPEFEYTILGHPPSADIIYPWIKGRYYDDHPARQAMAAQVYSLTRMMQKTVKIELAVANGRTPLLNVGISPEEPPHKHLGLLHLAFRVQEAGLPIYDRSLHQLYCHYLKQYWRLDVSLYCSHMLITQTRASDTTGLSRKRIRDDVDRYLVSLLSTALTVSGSHLNQHVVQFVRDVFTIRRPISTLMCPFRCWEFVCLPSSLQRIASYTFDDFRRICSIFGPPHGSSAAELLCWYLDENNHFEPSISTFATCLFRGFFANDEKMVEWLNHFSDGKSKRTVCGFARATQIYLRMDKRDRDQIVVSKKNIPDVLRSFYVCK